MQILQHKVDKGSVQVPGAPYGVCHHWRNANSPTDLPHQLSRKTQLRGLLQDRTRVR